MQINPHFIFVQVELRQLGPSRSKDPNRLDPEKEIIEMRQLYPQMEGWQSWDVTSTVREWIRYPSKASFDSYVKILLTFSWCVAQVKYCICAFRQLFHISFRNDFHFTCIYVT